MKPEYILIRSSRKAPSLEITRNATVVVHVLKRCPQREVDLFVIQRESWIQSALEQQRSRIEQYPEPDDEQREQLIRRIEEILPERVAYYSGPTELHPTSITIMEAVSRFDSCSPENRLCSPWRPMQYSMRAVDYVVVHGLARIRHKSHGRDFYVLVQFILPDYRGRWQLLKE